MKHCAPSRCNMENGSAPMSLISKGGCSRSGNSEDEGAVSSGANTLDSGFKQLGAGIELCESNSGHETQDVENKIEEGIESKGN